MACSVPPSQTDSALWTQAVDGFVAQLNPADAASVTCKASHPEQFIQALRVNRKSHKDDDVRKSLERISSALKVFASVVPDFTSVAWCSIELLYNRWQSLDHVRGTLEDVFIDLADSLPLLLKYERSAPYDDLNRSIVEFYRGILDLFLEINRFINESSKKRYNFGGPPDSSAISHLIKRLKKSKAEVEAEAIAVSFQQTQELREEVRTFVNKMVIEPKARLPCHMLAYPENPGFRGRREMLDRMADELKPTPGTLQSYGLYGLGGVGKTQLALKFAYSHLHLFKAVFWISAQTTGKLTQGLFDAAQQLGFVDSSTAAADQDKAVKDFMSWLKSCKEDWLIVFDNADDIDVLKPYWPCTNNGSILVTSREKAVLQRTRKCEPVDSMGSDDAKDVFFSAIEQHIERDEDNERLADEILKELGYLPLAITAAAGIIVQTECDLQDFIDLCRETNHHPEPFAYLEPDVASFDYEHTLATVWNISLQSLDVRSSQLLRILTFLDPDAVPVELLQKGARGRKDIDYLASTTTYMQIRKALFKHGLCSRANIVGDLASRGTNPGPVTTGIATHRLVLQTVFHRCSDAEKSDALAQAVALLKSEFPPVSESQFRLSDLWRECHILLPHVEAVMSRCFSSGLQLPRDVLSVLCACGRYLIERRSFTDAERLFAAAKEVCKAHGLHDWKQAQFVQRSLGGIIMESSTFRCDEAVQIFRDVVAHYEATLDAEDPVLGVTYSDLAQALTARGEYDEAISLCERAVEIVSKIQDDQTRRDNLFHVHHNMARVYEMKRLPAEALRLHFYEGDAQGNGLRQEQSVYGAWNLYAIGNCLQLQKDPRAMEIHAKALKIRQDLLGDHYYTAISYHKLGQLHLEDGAFQEANTAFREAHRILSDPLGNTQAELARTLWYWSCTKRKLPQEQAKEASELESGAIRIGSGLLKHKKAAGDQWVDVDFDNLVVYYNR